MFFGWFDAIFSFIFPILFLLFMGMFFFALISNLRTWNKNNHSPRLTVPATVVAKRTDVSHSSSANAGDVSGAHGYDTSTFTSYYVTFQVESGDRMEFEVDGSAYGPLKPKIAGALKTQLSDVALHEQTIIASVHFKFHAVAALHLKSHIVRCKCASVVSVRTGHISGIGTAGMRNIGALCYHCCRNGKPRRVVVFVPCAEI